MYCAMVCDWHIIRKHKKNAIKQIGRLRFDFDITFTLLRI